MKNKVDKFSNFQKQHTKVDPKPISKIASPKYVQNKGLTSYKSQKNLNKILDLNPDKQINGLDLSANNSSSQNTRQSILSIKTMKESGTLFDPKRLGSPKISSQLLNKPIQTGKFLRSKNPQQKQEDKLKRTLIEKEQKIEEIQKKNEQLEIKLQVLNKQRQKTQQIIQQIRLEKQSLEKNLQKYKNVAQENKKLLRQKAEGYNNNTNEIRVLRDQLQEYKQNKKNVSTSEVGINTEEPDITKEDEDNTIFRNQASTNTIQSQDNPLTHQNQETYEYYLNILSQLTIEDNIKLSIIKNLYKTMLEQKTQKIKQHQETIYSQQKQLNELYEQKYTRNIPQLTINTDQALLLEVNYSHQLKNQLQEQQERYYMLKEELWNKQREIQAINQDLKVKNLYLKEDLDKNLNQIKKTVTDKIQLENLKKQLQKTQSSLSEKEQKLKQLELKNNQQQKIIKTLKDNKPKIIVK